MNKKSEEDVESCMMLATESKLMLEGIQGVVEEVVGGAEYSLGIERTEQVL